MFTSLFQLEQKPVTVFSSNDAGAPVLTKDPGSLKTLLKACLVTGYGGKEGLGWEMQYESEDQKSAAFASTDPTASKFVFKIDNSSTTFALLSAYQTMTSIDVGVRPIVNANDYTLFAGAWRIIGHSKAFILLLDTDAVAGYPKVAMPIIFGDLPRETKRAAPVCLLWSARYKRCTGGLQSVLFEDVNGRNNSSNYGPGILLAAHAHPFVINDGASYQNLTLSRCKFTHKNASAAAALYEPVISCLLDSTWTMIPMLQPLSVKLVDVTNLGLVNSTAIKVVSGEYGLSDNNDCVVPTNWWYA